jgi:glyoxylase-like metal-dependent hydrolase (beta-lactamase superfamily II)
MIGTAFAGTMTPSAPRPQPIGPGTWLIAGGVLPARQPDGNTVVFEAPQGLIVVDTGRHEWHRAAILALAAERGRPIVAVINTHWHLDHVSGNPALRATFPQLRVYASNAIDGALAGFLASSAREYANYLDDPRFPETLREDIRADIVTIENGVGLKPDEVISTSTPMNLGGRTLQLNLARDAVTSGDVWLYDEQNGVAVLGDLVTLPVPFLDTACPEGWRAALTQITSTPFAIAIPGHGAPMAPADVARYRQAFEAFIVCAHSTRSKDSCATSWIEDVRALPAHDAMALERAKVMSANYVELLRTNGGRSKFCEAPLGRSPSH